MEKSRVILLLCIFGLFVSGCTESTVVSTPMNNDNVLATYEITEEQHPDDFVRWQETNEKRVAQDRWDATVGNINHELTVDVDVSDDFVECDKFIDVTVEIENKGDETETVRVQLMQDKLAVNAEKFIEVEPGHVRQIGFDVGVEASEGSYTFEAQVFRSVKFDRDNNVRDGGEFEGRASKTIFIAKCTPANFTQ